MGKEKFYQMVSKAIQENGLDALKEQGLIQDYKFSEPVLEDLGVGEGGVIEYSVHQDITVTPITSAPYINLYTTTFRTIISL